MNPTTWDTEYFGGIDNSIWTWSGIKCPSSTRLSLWPASLRNTSPRWVLNWPYSTFRRHFGMNTMWYLHSHVVWLKLSNLSIVVSSPLVCLAAHEGSFHDGHSLKCQTSTATPAEPGELPLGLDGRRPRPLAHYAGWPRNVSYMILIWESPSFFSTVSATS